MLKGCLASKLVLPNIDTSSPLPLAGPSNQLLQSSFATINIAQILSTSNFNKRQLCPGTNQGSKKTQTGKKSQNILINGLNMAKIAEKTILTLHWPIAPELDFSVIPNNEGLSSGNLVVHMEEEIRKALPE